MIQNLFSIYDVKAEEYGPIFEAKNNEVAKRKCKMEFKGVPDLVDYELVLLGQFDHEHGVISDIPDCLDDRFFVCKLSDLFVDGDKEIHK